jgi:membrane-bound ClpP family serine protease
MLESRLQAVFSHEDRLVGRDSSPGRTRNTRMGSADLGLAYILIAAGFLLMVAELFIPSGGILSVLSATGIIVGVALAFMKDTKIGMWTLAGVGVAVPIFVGVLLHYWPKTPIGKRFFLTAPSENDTVASMPEYREMEQLRGQIGEALSSLRPAGVVDFGGRRVDCMAEGNMVERGQTVRCIDVKNGRVIVRPIEKPNITGLESADFS